MNRSQQKLQTAITYAVANRPRIGGFPFLAECLRQAGVQKNAWSLPGAQSIYIMSNDTIVNQGTPLIDGMNIVPEFNKEALITALRTDQAGNSTFPEFLMSAWMAGVVKYDVDLNARIVIYYGARDESYKESYSAVEVGIIPFEK